MASPEVPPHFEGDSADALAAFNPEVAEPPGASAVPFESREPSPAIAPQVSRSGVSPDRVPPAVQEFEPPVRQVAQPAARDSADRIIESQRPSVSQQRSISAHSSIDAAAARIDSKRPSVSIAALIGAGLPPDANEAIAIGQGLCRSSHKISQQHSSSISALLKPDLNAVLIDSDGHVVVADADAHSISESIWIIASVLLELLPRDSHWLFRNRILSQALASPHLFTLNEFEQELSIYANGDSAKLICALYERWFAPHGELAVAAAEISPMVVERKNERPVLVGKLARAAQANYVRPAGIAAAVLFISGSIFLVGRRDIVAPVPPTLVPDVAPSASTATIFDVPPARLTPASNVSVSRPTPDDLARARSASTADRIPTRVGTTSGSTVTAPAPEQHPTEPPSVAVTRTSPVVDSAPAPASGTAVQRPSLPTPALPQPFADSIPPTAVVYSKDGEGVTPAIPVLPRQVAGLRPQTPDVRLDILTIEVVVDAQGRVNAVRGLVIPRSIGETLLLTQALSAVKSWPFRPATKDGVPVAYRQVVPVRELLRDAP
jgi:periplasmic protein TonB